MGKIKEFRREILWPYEAQRVTMFGRIGAVNMKKRQVCLENPLLFGTVIDDHIWCRFVLGRNKKFIIPSGGGAVAVIGIVYHYYKDARKTLCWGLERCEFGPEWMR